MTQSTPTTSPASLSPLATLLARAAQETAARLLVEKEANVRSLVEKAQAEVAEAIALWGDTPYSADIADDLLVVAEGVGSKLSSPGGSTMIMSCTTLESLLRAKDQCLNSLGVPEKVRAYLQGDGASEYFAGTGCQAKNHPATKATWEAREARRVAEEQDELLARKTAWLEQDKEFTDGGYVLDDRGGTMSPARAADWGVTEEYLAREARGRAFVAHREAQRVAAEESKRELLTAIVNTLGDADMKAARAEDKLAVPEIIQLVWAKVFGLGVKAAPGVARIDMPVGDAGTGAWWFHTDRGSYGSCDLYSRSETVKTCERVSAEAYRKLRALRVAIQTSMADLAQFGSVAADWDLKILTDSGDEYGEHLPRKAYMALCTVTIAGLITVSGRHPLASKVVG